MKDGIPTSLSGTDGCRALATLARQTAPRAPMPTTDIRLSARILTSGSLPRSNPMSARSAGAVVRRTPGKATPGGASAGTLAAGAGAPGATTASSGLKRPIAHSYTLVAHHPVTAHSVAAPVAATTTTASLGVVHVSGELSGNTTWSAAQASAYIVDGTVDVPKGVSLTIEPGTVVKALGDSITVEGSLSAVGSTADQIVFTSVNDNSVGGDTGSGSPAAGDWGGISSAGGGSVVVEHARVAYADLAVDAAGTGGLTVTDDSFSTDASGGVWADGPSAPVIKDSKFTSPGQDAAGVVATGTPTVEGDSVSGPASGVALAVAALAINPALLAGNTVSGPDVFDLSGRIATTGKLPPLNIPWSVGDFNGGSGNFASCLDIPAKVTLSLSPGTIVKGAGGSGGATNPTYCPSGGEGGSITVEGSLSAVGSTADQIVFTSVNDNSVGGDTGSGSPAAGDWGGISSAGNTKIEYATIAYAATAVNLKASPGINDAIHYDWFDDNQTALGGSSDWDPADTGVEPCQYVPQISSTHNTYGPGQQPEPSVSAADYATITAAILAGAESSPDGWTDNIAVGNSDTITWTVLPCIVGKEVVPDVATPYGFFTSDNPPLAKRASATRAPRPAGHLRTRPLQPRATRRKHALRNTKPKRS